MIIAFVLLASLPGLLAGSLSIAAGNTFLVSLAAYSLTGTASVLCLMGMYLTTNRLWMRPS